MEEREHPEHDVVTGEHRWVGGRGLLDVRDQGAVAQHRRPGPPGGPAGVEQHRQRLGVGGNGCGGALGGPQVVVPDLPGHGGCADDHDPRHRRPAAQLLVGADQGILEPGHRLPDRGDGAGVGDDHTRTAVGDHPDQLTGRGPRVDRHGHQPGPQRAEVAGHELHPVAERDRHPVAGDQPGGVQAPGDLVHLGVQVAPGDPPAGLRLDEGGPVRALRARPGEQLGKMRRHLRESGTYRERPCPTRVQV